MNIVEDHLAPIRDAGPVKVAMAPRTSAPAMVGFIFSMLWLGGIGSVIGIVLAYYGRQDIDGSRGQLRGRGLCTAADAIGVLGLIVTAIGIFAVVWSVFNQTGTTGY